MESNILKAGSYADFIIIIQNDHCIFIAFKIFLPKIIVFKVYKSPTILSNNFLLRIKCFEFLYKLLYRKSVIFFYGALQKKKAKVFQESNA